MKPVSADLAKAIERLKDDNDFNEVVNWIEDSLQEKIAELLKMDIHTMQVGQGYSQALDDLLEKIGQSRETLNRFNKKRDTR